MMLSFAAAIAVVLILAIADFALRGWRRSRFEKQFPPISDEQFMALCPPGTRPEIALKVRRIMSDHLVVEYARIYPSSLIVDDLGA